MVWMACAALACGPGTSTSDDGSGDGDGDGETATDDGATSADGADDTTSGGSDPTGAADTASEEDTRGEGDTDAESDSGEADSGGEAQCVLAIRIDLCCNQAYPATVAEVDAEDCVVLWPIDYEALDPDLVTACVAAQPDFCEIVDCDFAPPASEEVTVDASGACVYDCPGDMESPGYTDPGCGEPPPIVHCLPPPPPCADEYCSCEGETIIGCGQTGEPFEHMGPCE